MNPRQQYALEHPLDRADMYGELMNYRRTRPGNNGATLMSILAVDR